MDVRAVEDHRYLLALADHGVGVEVDEQLPRASAEGRGAGQLLVSLDPDTVIGEGEEIEVVFDRSNIHVFDSDTGEAITHRLR